MRKWAVVGATLALLAGGLLAGCSAGSPQSTAQPVDDPFADCAGIVSSETVSGLPDLTLPCFHGGKPVRLSQLTGPVVVNLWASWCPPCRQELPAFGRLAQRSGGKLTVLGVVTGDSRDSAAALAKELGLAFPAVFDEKAKLSSELVHLKLASAALPVTLFINGGTVVFTYQDAALDETALDRLVGKHLGVRQ
jgi:thiol-disulfide isomerase/thioredoxin